MKIQIQKPLFAWDCLEDHPVLATIKQLLETIPDGKLMEGLEAARGKGRNDYPVRALWGVVLLTIALRHTGFEACLGELRRNPALAKLIGIGLRRGDSQRLEPVAVPRRTRPGTAPPGIGGDFQSDDPAAGRGCARLGAGYGGRFHGVEGPASAVRPPQNRRGDGEGRQSRPLRARPGTSRTRSNLTDTACRRPAGDARSTRTKKGTSARSSQWFGYKLHLLVDAKHEVALVWRVSSTKAGDNELLPALVDQARANLPKGRIRTLAYDKAADTVDAHEKLHACGIKPVIQNRALWKEEQEKTAPRPRRQLEHRLRRGGNPVLLRPRELADGPPAHGLYWPRAVAGHAEVPLPGKT